MLSVCRIREMSTSGDHDNLRAGMATLEDNLRTLIKIFRRQSHRVLQSERTIVHGANDMLMVLQLAMAEVNKQVCGEFKVGLSDVLVAWKHLLLDRLHLPLDNAARPANYELILDAYAAFLKRSNAADLVDLLSAYHQLREESDPEEIVNSVQLFRFLTGDASLPDMAESASVPSTPSSTHRLFTAQVSMEVRRVFCSYLTLLVNSQSDLALARVLDVPSRALGHGAFTDLKRAARHGNTSLFLAVTSFVRAVQLGGKGYAPAETDPLRKHIKGLSDFVQFSDHLEEILGETPDPSVCGGRLVAAIRVPLVKGRASSDAACAACDRTAADLKEALSQLHQRRACATVDATGISPARPKAYAVNHATAYGGRDTVKLLLALLDEEALNPPCRTTVGLLLSPNGPAVFDAEVPDLLTLFRSPEGPTGCSPEPLKNRVQRRQDSLKPKSRRSQRCMRATRPSSTRDGRPEEKPADGAACPRGGVEDEGLVLRSQFACTYQEEGGREEEEGQRQPLNRVLEFPSSSQMPTCVHPAPKRPCPPASGQATQHTAAQAGAGPAPESLGAPCGQAVPRCVNGNARGSGTTGVSNQTRGKGGKRKRAGEAERRVGGSENQPPLKKAILEKPPATKASRAPGRKLIAGQGKLTSFFRL